MFINEIQKLIWQPITNEFNQTIGRLQQASSVELKQYIIKYLSELSSNQKGDRFYQSYHFMTCGCPHYKCGASISGCTFCNFITPHITLFSLCSLLRDRDVNLYNDVVLYSIECCRKANIDPPIILFFSGFDTLSPREIPDSLLLRIENSGVFDNRTTRLIAFEARADSVTRERLLRYRKLTDKQMGVNLGVEATNEWLRNHWINKDIYDCQIDQAACLIQELGFQLSFSILLGIPGLSQRQSLDLFVESFLYLWDHYHPDTIMCSPLVVKPNTLQYTLDQIESKDNQSLDVWDNNTLIFFVYEALCRVVEQRPEANRAIKLFKDFIKEISCSTDISEEFGQISQLLIQCIRKNDFMLLLTEKDRFCHSRKYQDFLQNLVAQNSIDKLTETMLYKAQLLVKHLTPKPVQNRLISLFLEELKLFSETNNRERH